MIRALVVVALLSSTAHAELDEKGVRVGGTVFAMSRSGDAEDNMDMMSEALISQPGWMVGAWATWRQTDNLALQVEVAVSNNRLENEVCGGTGNVTTCTTVQKISLYYLEVPLLLRIDVLPNATKMHFDLGIEGALNLGGGTTPMGGSFGRFEDLNPANVGGVVGLGFEFAVGPGSLAIDARYKRWIAPITDDSEPAIGFGSDNREIKPSHHVMLTVGYAFP